MITKELINPRSIVVVGASNDVGKPGGKLLKNILDGNFKGDLYASNPKEKEIQGIKSYKNLELLPQVDAILYHITPLFKFLADNARNKLQSVLREISKK